MAPQDEGRPARFIERFSFLSATLLAFVALGTLVLTFTPPQSPALKFVLFLLIMLTIAVPMANHCLQWLAVGGRHLLARLAVRRARAIFRTTLRAARRHPELAELDRLREAASSLVRYASATEVHGFAEVVRAARHPYRPIQDAALTVLGASSGREESKAPSSEPSA